MSSDFMAGFLAGELSTASFAAWFFRYCLRRMKTMISQHHARTASVAPQTVRSAEQIDDQYEFMVEKPGGQFVPTGEMIPSMVDPHMACVAKSQAEGVSYSARRVS